MRLIDKLNQATSKEKEKLLNCELIIKCLNKNIELDEYYNFLTQAYHHVKETTPLFMLAGSKLQRTDLQKDFIEYINEEFGHEQWILNDIKNCGYNAEQVEKSKPALACELFVSYAYDCLNRGNPLSLLGMVYVLEGTSKTIATEVAHIIMEELELPKSTCSYLLSHGDLDIEHFAFFEKLLDKIEEKDHDDIISAAKVFFILYQEILNSVVEKEFSL